MQSPAPEADPVAAPEPVVEDEPEDDFECHDCLGFFENDEY